jgi:hypothetical protein
MRPLSYRYGRAHQGTLAHQLGGALENEAAGGRGDGYGRSGMTETFPSAAELRDLT